MLDLKRLTIGVSVVVFGCNQEHWPPSEVMDDRGPADETISIDASAVMLRQKHLFGAQHGFYFNPQNTRFRWDSTVTLLRALKPTVYAVFPKQEATDNEYAFVTQLAQLPQTAGTEVMLSFMNAFNRTQPGGAEIKVGATDCVTNSSQTCYETFGDLKDAWTSHVEAFSQRLLYRFPALDVIEAFAEPDLHMEGVGKSQLFELFKIFHDAVRQHAPHLKISGPALGDYRAQELKEFLSYVRDNHLRLDVLNWHENLGHDPEAIPAHTAELRSFMEMLGGLCTDGCPKIYIMEYLSPDNHFIPGAHLGYLANMEAAGVDASGSSCWWVPSGPDTGYNDCLQGGAGLFLADNLTPQPKYWEVLAYTQLPLARLTSSSSSKNLNAIAGRDDAVEEVQALVGRNQSDKLGKPARPKRVSVTIKEYPYAAHHVSVRVERIPVLFQDYGNDRYGPVGLPGGPQLVSEDTLAVDQGGVTLWLDAFADGDVYRVTLTPR